MHNAQTDKQTDRQTEIRSCMHATPNSLVRRYLHMSICIYKQIRVHMYAHVYMKDNLQSCNHPTLKHTYCSTADTNNTRFTYSSQQLQPLLKPSLTVQANPGHQVKTGSDRTKSLHLEKSRKQNPTKPTISIPDPLNPERPEHHRKVKETAPAAPGHAAEANRATAWKGS